MYSLLLEFFFHLSQSLRLPTTLCLVYFPHTDHSRLMVAASPVEHFSFRSCIACPVLPSLFPIMSSCTKPSLPPAFHSNTLPQTLPLLCLSKLLPAAASLPCLAGRSFSLLLPYPTAFVSSLLIHSLPSPAPRLPHMLLLVTSFFPFPSHIHFPASSTCSCSFSFFLHLI